jgi:hypothetical protein
LKRRVCLRILAAGSVIWISAAGPELCVVVVDDVSSTSVRYEIVSTLFFCRSFALRSQCPGKAPALRGIGYGTNCSVSGRLDLCMSDPYTRQDSNRKYWLFASKSDISSRFHTDHQSHNIIARPSRRLKRCRRPFRWSSNRRYRYLLCSSNWMIREK